MAQCYFLPILVLSAGMLTLASPAAAQPAAPDSTQHPRPLLLKAGLRLTHLRYTHDSKSWQFLLPLSLGAEYRLAPRLNVYTQLEADMQAIYTSNRRRATRRSTLAAASVALGVRYYYGGGPQAAPRFGRYLALEGTTDWEQLTDARWLRTSPNGRRATPAVLTPGIYALWGVQHRLRHHTYYDVSAGVGVLAPAYYNFERPSTATAWNVGGQASIRLYFGL
jgi:hypothetical protein